MKKKKGILEASVALATNTGRFVYDTEVTGPRDVIESIEGIGYTATLATNDKKKDRIDHTQAIKK